MRLGWRIPLIRPFYLAGTVWRSRPRRREVYHATLPDGWRCPHDHRRPDTALACARREAARRDGMRNR